MATSPPRKTLTPNTLPYRKPQAGRDYWVVDKVLPNALDIAERCFGRTDWIYGQPWRNETWPGMRALNALTPDELAHVEAIARRETGAKRLWSEEAPGEATSNHNCVQLVGATDSGPRPHSDSRKLCRYAAVIYLSPKPQAFAGTAFYRLRFPNGGLGGNYCPAPYANLREALGVVRLPVDAWVEDVRIDNVFNRLAIYRAEFVHSASGYFGLDLRDKRMTAVFFWMA